MRSSLLPTLLLTVLLRCAAQQIGVADTGVITGTLAGDDGTPIAGADVTLQSTDAPAPIVRRSRTMQRSVRTGEGGLFRFDQLNVGAYRLCAQAPGTLWLDPCEWKFTVPTVPITERLRQPEVKIVLKKGAAVPIRIDDAGQHLERNEGKNIGAHLLMGITTRSATFQVARQISKDSTSRVYQVVVPFDTTVNAVISSSRFKLTDTTGLALSKIGGGIGTAIPILVRSGQPVPSLRFLIAGVN